MEIFLVCLSRIAEVNMNVNKPRSCDKASPVYNGIFTGIRIR